MRAVAIALLNGWLNELMSATFGSSVEKVDCIAGRIIPPIDDSEKMDYYLKS